MTPSLGDPDPDESRNQMASAQSMEETIEELTHELNARDPDNVAIVGAVIISRPNTPDSHCTFVGPNGDLSLFDDPNDFLVAIQQYQDGVENIKLPIQFEKPKGPDMGPDLMEMIGSMVGGQ